MFIKRRVRGFSGFDRSGCVADRTRLHCFPSHKIVQFILVKFLISSTILFINIS